MVHETSLVLDRMAWSRAGLGKALGPAGFVFGSWGYRIVSATSGDLVHNLFF